MTEKDKQLFTEAMENTKKRISNIDEELATTTIPSPPPTGRSGQAQKPL
jgi:hypothetical protein